MRNYGAVGRLQTIGRPETMPTFSPPPGKSVIRGDIRGRGRDREL